MILNIRTEQGTGTQMSLFIFSGLYTWDYQHQSPWASWPEFQAAAESPLDQRVRGKSPFVIPTKYGKHFKEIQIKYSTKLPSSNHHEEKPNLKCPMRLGKSWAQEQWLDRNAVPCQKPWGEERERSMSNCHMLMEKLMSSQILHKPTPEDPRGEQRWLWNVKVTEVQILTED